MQMYDTVISPFLLTDSTAATTEKRSRCTHDIIPVYLHMHRSQIKKAKLSFAQFDANGLSIWSCTYANSIDIMNHIDTSRQATAASSSATIYD